MSGWLRVEVLDGRLELITRDGRVGVETGDAQHVRGSDVEIASDGPVDVVVEVAEEPEQATLGGALDE